MKTSFALLAPLALFLVAAAPAQAGREIAADHKTAASDPFPFAKGNHEFQLLAGPFFSINHAPDFNYAIGTLRAGWMLSTPGGESILRGNTEFLVEAFGGGIFDGPGDALVGASLLLRYNFVGSDGASFVPYVQIGAGGVYSDAHEDRDQRLIGSEFSFNLQAGIGFHFFINERWALTLEGSYRHISNANTSDRNTGVDAIGGQIGVSYFY
jgi:opacity protein-like surface antigen